jgi:hypothetical protein
MNCFVIMPYDRDFDDVYATIKRSVKDAGSSQNPVRCFRLDDARPAGRITDRLINELRSATICIADLTGGKPNVMWEVGYAMALGKPTIIITQETGELPFDIRVMETIHYDRNRMSDTLARPLERSIIDTLSLSQSAESAPSKGESQALIQMVGELLEQIRDLRSIVNQSVRAWNPTPEQGSNDPVAVVDARVLEGAWINHALNTHIYASVVRDELVAPYCYGGDDRLTSVYYGWKKVGDLWFARFCWFNRSLSGFAFLKHEAIDLLVGAWWYDDDVTEVPNTPDLGSGTSIRWERIRDASCPAWASQFFEDVQRDGIVKRLAAARVNMVLAEEDYLAEGQLDF